MKIEFPLWLVVDPSPMSEVGDIVWTADDVAQLAARLAWFSEPLMKRFGTVDKVALYTSMDEAIADAKARIVARDNAKEAEWVPLSTLRPGAIFEAKTGDRGVLRAEPALASDRVRVVWLGSGEDATPTGTLLVREIKP